MKYLKMLGLAAIAAAALMAIGAGSASATVLCNVTPEGTSPTATCPEGHDYGANTVISSHLVTGGTATLRATFATVVCHTSEVGGKTSNTGGASETVSGPIETLTFTSCECNGVAGATATVLAKGSLEVHWIEGGHNGTLTASGTRVTIHCVNPEVNCTYGTGANRDIGTLVGGNPAVLKAEEASIPFESGDGSLFICGNGKWTAEYVVTSPTPLYVGSVSP